MKVCDQCQKKIEGVDFIQVTFVGKVQQIPLMFKRAFQFEFCSLNCFQEFFNLLSREQYEEDEQRKKERDARNRIQ